MIGYKHTQIWQLYRDQGRKQGSATDMLAGGGRGGDIPNIQYAVPGGEIHLQDDDVIWTQLDQKLSVVFWTNNGKISPSQWS